MSSTDISALISRVALRDRAAFEQLYAATSAKLFGICLRVIKVRTEAEVVLQEVYIKIWHNAGKFKISSYSPMTWLIAVARNHAIDRVRARKPSPIELSHAYGIADPGATPEQAALHGGEVERLRACLEKLPAARAEAIRAAYIEGYSYQELAARMREPLNTVRTWLRRSLISLRECLSS
jgi:RNA polymerase sigma-70 factor (ECF subfamily)